VHEKGEHSKGSLIHDDTSGVLLYGNVYISNRERNALFKGGARAAIVNNLIFNPGRFAVHYNLWAQEWQGKTWQTGRLSLVGNQLRHGPSTEPDTAFFTQRASGHLELYMADNPVTDRERRPVAAVRDGGDNQASRAMLAQPDLPAGLRIRPAAGLEAELRGIIGARPWDRDALDHHVLAEMAAGRGRIINSERENAIGYPPALPPVRRAFAPEAWHLDDMSSRAGWASLFGKTD
jgi:hypothetical protein